MNSWCYIGYTIIGMCIVDKTCFSGPVTYIHIYIYIYTYIFKLIAR